MKMFPQTIFIILLSGLLASCEKVIDLEVPAGESLPYLDAWITNQPGIQEIRFLKAVNYLDQAAPQPVPDAQISIEDVTAGQTFNFVYNNGVYQYDPGNAGPLGIIGHQYKLSVSYKGESFEAMDELKRVTTIDSITSEFKKEDGGDKEGYFAEFFANDLPGATDYNWIRTYKNGVLNNFTAEMVSIDGSFNEGLSDGFMFIPPFREGITSSQHPYEKNDVVKVLIRSLSKGTYEFLGQVIEQLYSGGLFAKVLLNVPSNIVNKQPSSKLKIYGWFGAVGESQLSATMQ